MTPDRFPDQFLPALARGDREAWQWAREEAAQLPPAVLAVLDPFAVRDRIACYERQSGRGAWLNGLLLRAVLDRVVAWQADRACPRPAPQRGQHGGGER
jgi:hypothetical protein